MNHRRFTAASVTAALLVPAAAACDPSTAGSADTGTAAVSATDAANLPTCTPIYGTDGSGITVSHGTVTGTMMLTCDPVPVSGQVFQVTISLDYLSGTDSDAAPLDLHTITGYQDTYTATAPCKPGVWAISAVLSGTTGGHLPAPSTVTITNCSTASN